MCLGGYSFWEMSLKCCYCSASKVRRESGSTGPASYTTVILCAPCNSLFLDHSQFPRQEFACPPTALFSAGIKSCSSTEISPSLCPWLDLNMYSLNNKYFEKLKCKILWSSSLKFSSNEQIFLKSTVNSLHVMSIFYLFTVPNRFVYGRGRFLMKLHITRKEGFNSAFTKYVFRNKRGGHSDISRHWIDLG